MDQKILVKVRDELVKVVGLLNAGIAAGATPNECQHLEPTKLSAMGMDNITYFCECGHSWEEKYEQEEAKVFSGTGKEG